MNHTAIQNEVRRRVVAAASITAANELKLPGELFDTSQKTFWVEEHLIGGEMRNITNQRNRVSSYLVQYDLCCPAGKAMGTLETKAAMIESSLIDNSFSLSGMNCIVKKIKVSRNESKLRNTVSVLLTLEVHIL